MAKMQIWTQLLCSVYAGARAENRRKYCKAALQRLDLKNSLVFFRFVFIVLASFAVLDRMTEFVVNTLANPFWVIPVGFKIDQHYRIATSAVNVHGDRIGVRE